MSSLLWSRLELPTLHCSFSEVCIYSFSCSLVPSFRRHPARAPLCQILALSLSVSEVDPFQPLQSSLWWIPLHCPHVTIVEEAEANKTESLSIIIGLYFSLVEKNWTFNKYCWSKWQATGGNGSVSTLLIRKWIPDRPKMHVKKQTNKQQTLE